MYPSLGPRRFCSSAAWSYPKFTLNGKDIMRVVDGKITETYHVEELLKLTQQISTGARSA